MGHVLIADDIAISRETLARVLRDAGHRVLSVASAEEVLEYARAHVERPDLAILDLNMPRMTGLQLVPLLKAEFPGQFFPTMIVSGRTLTATELTQVLSVAEDFLRKPYTPTELCARIEVWLRTRRFFDSAQQSGPLANRPSVPSSPSRATPSPPPPSATLVERIDEEWRRSLRWNEPFALLLCEAQPPSAEADVVMQQLTRIAARSLRQIDIPGMVAASRLTILLPHTPPAGALTAAERLRAAMVDLCQGERSGCAIFFGLALVPGRDIASPEDLLRAAEVALKRACQEGPFSLCLHQHQGYIVRDR